MKCLAGRNNHHSVEHTDTTAVVAVFVVQADMAESELIAGICTSHHW